MATNSVKLTIVGSDFASPTQFTAQSPSFYRYFPIPNNPFVEFGDYAGAFNPVTQQTAAGFIYVQFHQNNQWVTGKYYTVENGAAIATLLG
jgi:hypothetical protein